MNQMIFARLISVASASTHATVTTGGSAPATTPGIDKIVLELYQFALLGAGLLAFVVILYGAAKYTLSGGSPSAKTEAKDKILQALLGLLLLLGTYIVLNTVNPDLVSVKLPSLSVVRPVSFSAPGGSGVGSGVCAPVTSGPAAEANLATGCFGANARQASMIASVESAGNRFGQSQVDKCKDGKSFSIGLFQINIIANARLVGECSRSQIFQVNGSQTAQGNCLDNRGGVCFQYDCQVINQAAYSQCVARLSDPDVNIGAACTLSNNGANWGPWSYSKNKCGL